MDEATQTYLLIAIAVVVYQILFLLKEREKKEEQIDDEKKLTFKLLYGMVKGILLLVIGWYVFIYVGALALEIFA